MFVAGKVSLRHCHVGGEGRCAIQKDFRGGQQDIGAKVTTFLQAEHYIAPRMNLLDVLNKGLRQSDEYNETYICHIFEHYPQSADTQNVLVV